MCKDFILFDGWKGKIIKSLCLDAKEEIPILCTLSKIK